MVEVYDDERHMNSKPTVGFKLNKPAIITLFNIKPREGLSSVQKEQSLKNVLENNDGS